MRWRSAVFDSWYSGLENLKAIRGLRWRWLTQVKENRNVNLDRQGLSRSARRRSSQAARWFTSKVTA